MAFRCAITPSSTARRWANRVSSRSKRTTRIMVWASPAWVRGCRPASWAAQEPDAVVDELELGLRDRVGALGVVAEDAIQLGRVGKQLERARAHGLEGRDHRVRHGGLEIAVPLAGEVFFELRHRG